MEVRALVLAVRLEVVEVLELVWEDEFLIMGEILILSIRPLPLIKRKEDKADFLILQVDMQQEELMEKDMVAVYSTVVG